MARYLDLIGQTFNHLTVLRRSTNDAFGAAHWECICDCDSGKITRVRTASLVSGKTCSCGCSHKTSAPIKNLIDLRSGKLTVIRRSYEKPRRSRNIEWITQCDCDPEGRTLNSYPGYLLSSGKQASCGCASRSGEIVRSETARNTAKQLRNKKYGYDLKYTINVRIKSLVQQSLKNKRSIKSQNKLKSLGYSINELEKHLLTTMPQGYSWSDYLKGILHIDHKRPLAVFNFTSDTDPEFQKAWALSNLQLMTAEANRIKRDKEDDLIPLPLW